AIHAAGFLHRAVCPRNALLVQTSGAWKLLDVAAAAAGAAPGAATLPYVAPELVAGRSADERADVYSLTATLYTAITGRAPFTADTLLALAVAAAERSPVDPTVFAD